MIMSKVKSIGQKASHWTEHIEKAISLQKFAYGNMCDSRQPIKKRAPECIRFPKVFTKIHISI